MRKETKEPRKVGFSSCRALKGPGAGDVQVVGGLILMGSCQSESPRAQRPRTPVAPGSLSSFSCFLFLTPCFFLFSDCLLLKKGKEQEWHDPCLLPGLQGELPSTFSEASGKTLETL